MSLPVQMALVNAPPAQGNRSLTQGSPKYEYAWAVKVVGLLTSDFLQRLADASSEPQLGVQCEATIRCPRIIDRPIGRDYAAPAVIDADGREPARSPEDLSGAADTAGIQIEYRLPLQSERPAMERHRIEKIAVLKLQPVEFRVSAPACRDR